RYRCRDQREILSFPTRRSSDLRRGANMEKTFLMVKPDGVQRHLTGEIVQRLENKGFKLVGAKLMNISNERAETHYAEHKERPFRSEEHTSELQSRFEIVCRLLL